MKSKLFVLAGLMALVVSASVRADAVPSLPADVMVELRVSGGFVAPSVSGANGVEVRRDGSVVAFAYSRMGGGALKRTDTVVARLSDEKVKTLAYEITKIREGELVDRDPSGPQGADFPNVAYTVNQNGKAIRIADRMGNAHLVELQQFPAQLIKQLLDALETVANYRGTTLR